MSNEPVVTAGAIVGALGAGLVMLVSLGVINLTPDQQTNILTFAAAVLPLGGALIARRYVTPDSKLPKTDE